MITKFSVLYVGQIELDNVGLHGTPANERRSSGMPRAPARAPSIREGVAQKAWLCGPPALVIEQIREFEARYPGLEHMMIHWAEGMPPKEFKEQLSWFARDVMPAFAGRR
jgi:hypothetical protein